MLVYLSAEPSYPSLDFIKWMSSSLLNSNHWGFCLFYFCGGSKNWGQGFVSTRLPLYFFFFFYIPIKGCFINCQILCASLTVCVYLGSNIKISEISSLLCIPSSFITQDPPALPAWACILKAGVTLSDLFLLGGTQHIWDLEESMTRYKSILTC